MTIQITYLIAVISAYLLGSVSSAILISGIMQLPDPRGMGSGNPGATNVLRTGNRLAAALTLIGDLLKGFVPVLLGQLLQFEVSILCVIGIATIVGHMYPLYYHFRGGKGVATTLGVLLGISWPLALIWVIVWISVARLSRYSSLAALVATSLLPIAAWLFDYRSEVVTLTVGICALIFWRHRNNIKNLLQNTEAQIGKEP